MNKNNIENTIIFCPYYNVPIKTLSDFQISLQGKTIESLIALLETTSSTYEKEIITKTIYTHKKEMHHAKLLFGEEDLFAEKPPMTFFQRIKKLFN